MVGEEIDLTSAVRKWAHVRHLTATVKAEDRIVRNLVERAKSSVYNTKSALPELESQENAIRTLFDDIDVLFLYDIGRRSFCKRLKMPCGFG